MPTNDQKPQYGGPSPEREKAAKKVAVCARCNQPKKGLLRANAGQRKQTVCPECHATVGRLGRDIADSLRRREQEVLEGDRFEYQPDIQYDGYNL